VPRRDPRATRGAAPPARASRRLRAGRRRCAWPWARPDRRARLLGQRCVVRRLRLRAPSRPDRDARLDQPDGLLRRRAGHDGLGEVCELLERHLPLLERAVTSIAVPFASVGRMFVIGRGPEFATAREIALKLLETCQIAAEPLTATDLVHGPVAALDPLFPVWAVANEDKTLQVVVEATARARAAGATIVASGTAAEALEDA